MLKIGARVVTVALTKKYFRKYKHWIKGREKIKFQNVLFGEWSASAGSASVSIGSVGVEAISNNNDLIK